MVSVLVECQERQRLTDLWHERAEEYDRCVTALADANNGASHVDALRKFEEAGVAMDNAHAVLQIHRAEHGC